MKKSLKKFEKKFVLSKTQKIKLVGGEDGYEPRNFNSKRNHSRDKD